MDDEYQRDEDLRQQQGGRAFRVGKVLRGTYDADAPELEPSMTRLMLELARVPSGREDATVAAPGLSFSAGTPPAVRSAGPAAPRGTPSLGRRIAAWLHLG